MAAERITILKITPVIETSSSISLGTTIISSMLVVALPVMFEFACVFSYYIYSKNIII
jgi:hypothetical protein